MIKIARHLLLGGMIYLFLFPPCPVTARTSLWKIETENNSVFLLGSIHLLRQSDYPLQQEMEQAYNSAQVLVFETDLDSADSPAAQSLFAARGLLPAGTTLNEVLSDSMVNLIRLLTAQVELEMQVIERFKPWAAAMILSLQKMNQLGIDPAFGLDRHFFEKAKKDGKSILTFESLEFQIELLNTLSEPDQEQFLSHSFEEFAQLQQEMPRLIRAWRSGDEEEAADVLTAGFYGYPELYQRLIKSRNEEWMARIESLLGGTDDVLVVVGLGHLVGEHGLVRQLRGGGVVVEQQ